MEYEIQIDNGIGGQCYEEFDSLESAAEWAVKWAMSGSWRHDGEVKIQVRKSIVDEWEHEETIEVKANSSR